MAMLRFMVFVDGSNLVGDLRRKRLRVDDYEHFYTYVLKASALTWRHCAIADVQPAIQLVRVLWYALGDLDRWNLDDAKAQASLRDTFESDRELKRKYMALAGQKLGGGSQAETAREAWSMCFAEILAWYEERSRRVEGFRRFYHGVRTNSDFIDIIECAHWKVDMLHQSVDEKGLDTRLAVDMVTLIDTYDVAILVSGDADNIPSLDYVKQRGKQVGVVELLAGYPPEKKSPHASSRLKVKADFVVQVYEMDLVREKIAVPEGTHGGAHSSPP
jgi:uncharacterized LabA/DUF88 family protein